MGAQHTYHKPSRQVASLLGTEHVITRACVMTPGCSSGKPRGSSHTGSSHLCQNEAPALASFTYPYVALCYDGILHKAYHVIVIILSAGLTRLKFLRGRLGAFGDRQGDSAAFNSMHDVFLPPLLYCTNKRCRSWWSLLHAACYIAACSC